MRSVVPLRPAIKPALRRVWRDATTLQVGLDPRHAFVLSGVSAATAQLIDQCDGTHDIVALRACAAKLGLASGAADRLLALLAEASVLDDSSADARPLAALTLVERERLAPDLASASLSAGAADGGISTIRRRQDASVRLLGAGRVGAAVAGLLAAAGIGRIVIDDSAIATQADRSPGGIDLDGVGGTRGHAAELAVHRASASTSTLPLRSGDADVVIVATEGALDSSRLDDLVRAGTPHLFATIREVTGMVGPFVFPGSSACRRCLDLHRRDRDPSWPVIAAQLATEARRRRATACDVVLAHQLAAICVSETLRHLDHGSDHDGRSDPATRNGTLELRTTDWRIRRRSWPPHPACGCHWPAADPGAGPLNSMGTVTPATTQPIRPTHPTRSSQTMEA